MSTTYRYKGFQLNKIDDTLYTIDRGDEEHAVIEKVPETYGGGWVAYRPHILGMYGHKSDRITRNEGSAKTLKALFQNWVNENYGDAYARKN